MDTTYPTTTGQPGIPATQPFGMQTAPEQAAPHVRAALVRRVGTLTPQEAAALDEFVRPETLPAMLKLMPELEQLMRQAARPEGLPGQQSTAPGQASPQQRSPLATTPIMQG